MLLGSNTLTKQPTSLFHGEVFGGLPVSKSFKGYISSGALYQVFTVKALRQCLKFLGLEITLPEHVRKGPPPTVLEQEKPLLANIMLSREKALDIEKNTRRQFNCSAWYQERAFRITASRFGEVVSRKAPVNDRFLHSLFASTKVQIEAMKYGLDNETVVVKEFKELSGA